MAYEVVMPYHLHMPSYFLETFTEYPLLVPIFSASSACVIFAFFLASSIICPVKKAFIEQYNNMPFIITEENPIDITLPLYS